MSDTPLPLQILTNILSRLPIKPLLRFKCVSKSWYLLITSTHFIKLHLNQCLSSGSHIHILISDKTLFSVPLPTLENHHLYYRIKPTNLNPPIIKPPSTLHLHGSCNGILCISNSHNPTSVFLFNPSTKSHRFLPPFSPSKITTNLTNPFLSLVEYGFGYDSLSDDYKVLRIIQTRENRKAEDSEASMYSLKNDSWKCVNDGGTQQYAIVMVDGNALVNETIHLIVYDKTVWNCKPLIKCFNLRDETFSTMQLPRREEYVMGLMFAVRELGGCLCVLANYHSKNESSSSYGLMPDFKLLQADLWVMKEYGKKESWVKLFSIRKPECMGSVVGIKPVVYSRDEYRVLLELDKKKFGWYDLGRDKFKRVDAYGVPVGSFVESLVSLEKDKVSFVESHVSLEINKVQPKGLAVPKKSRKKKNRTKDDSSSTDFKRKLGDQTKDASGIGNARDDSLHKEFKLRLSERTDDATDLCNA